MYKEDVDISQIIKQEISQVIDQWVNDLVKEKLAGPMSPNLQRGLWDRLKGTLSNIWHGRYNQSNPNYWKNRFGDDLGVEESYSPSVFTLDEYKQLRNAVKEAEEVVKENAADVEKLRIVRMIRTAAEELKKKLYSIFIKSCSTAAPDGSAAGADPAPAPAANDTKEKGGETASGASVGAIDPEAAKAGTMQPPDRESEVGAEEMEPNEEKTVMQDSPRRRNFYIAMKPKVENKGKSIRYLWRLKQYVDAILHEDFESTVWDQVKDSKEVFLKYIQDLLHDARMLENKKTIEKIEEARDKLLALYEREENS